MQPRQYAERLRRQGHTYATIRALVSLVYGKPVNYRTILNWLSPKRREAQRRYMKQWQRHHRAANKPKSEPITDRDRFKTTGPFKVEREE